MPKPKPKPRRFGPPPVAKPPDTNSTEEIERQFEVELCWCIQQLQTALRLGKLSPKQVQDHTKTLNVLMSNTAPYVQKRQVMRLSFGDYRSKMAAEEKKLHKVNLQVKVSPGKPNPKSVFVKKSAFMSSDSSFKFNFEPPNNDKVDPNMKMEEEESEMIPGASSVPNNGESVKKCANSRFIRSDNSFKFNFNVAS